MTVDEELQGGMKNALEKGVPLEKIIQTFLNAGYPKQAVQAAANAVSEGATTIAAPMPKNIPEIPNQAPSFPQPTAEEIPKQASEGIGKGKIILLVGILIILLVLLGASLLFREQFIALIS